MTENSISNTSNIAEELRDSVNGAKISSIDDNLSQLENHLHYSNK